MNATFDEELIKQAENLHYTEWYYVDSLITRAQSEETKEKLKNIKSRMYHREEYKSGLL